MCALAFSIQVIKKHIAAKLLLQTLKESSTLGERSL